MHKTMLLLHLAILPVIGNLYGSVEEIKMNNAITGSGYRAKRNIAVQF
jgi:hypothetical protein